MNDMNTSAELAEGDVQIFEHRLRAVLEVVRRYLPPGGSTAHQAIGEIIALVDPWPKGSVDLGSDDVDARRYRFLRQDAGIRDRRPFIAISEEGVISQWTGIFADRKVDAAIANTQPKE